MKVCPTCNRTYSDDTFTFCLEDGARLSSPKPHSTLQEMAPRDTDPPRTEILASEPTLVRPNQSPAGPTIPAFAPPIYQQTARSTQPAERRSGKYWAAVTGILVLVVIGLVTVLGYVAWKANLNPVTEPTKSSFNPPTQSNVSSNPNGATETKRAEPKTSEWLEGMWEGRGFQSNTKTTWIARLTAHDAQYAIDYPDIPCRGKWNLVDESPGEATFTEVITQGLNRCSTNGKVMIQRVSDSQISCKFTYARSRVVIATAVLNRKGPSLLVPTR